MRISEELACNLIENFSGWNDLASVLLLLEMFLTDGTEYPIVSDSSGLTRASATMFQFSLQLIPARRRGEKVSEGTLPNFQ